MILMDLSKHVGAGLVASRTPSPVGIMRVMPGSTTLTWHEKLEDEVPRRFTMVDSVNLSHQPLLSIRSWQSALVSIQRKATQKEITLMSIP